jgi:hypothetical protein
MEVFMRKTLLAVAAATALFTAGTIVSDRADAMTLGSGIQSAADAVATMDKAGYGYRYRPRYYRPYRPYYRPYY